MASKLVETLPQLISATFSEVSTHSLEFKVIRLMRRRHRHKEPAASATFSGGDLNFLGTKKKISHLSSCRWGPTDSGSRGTSLSEYLGRVRRARGPEVTSRAVSGEEAPRGQPPWASGIKGAASHIFPTRSQGDLQSKNSGQVKGDLKRGSLEGMHRSNRVKLAGEEVWSDPGAEDLDELFLFSQKNGTSFPLNEVALQFTGG